MQKPSKYFPRLFCVVLSAYFLCYFLMMSREPAFGRDWKIRYYSHFRWSEEWYRPRGMTTVVGAPSIWNKIFLPADLVYFTLFQPKHKIGVRLEIYTGLGFGPPETAP